MRLISGQFITWGEFFTMGLTIFASLMTVWLARPVKMTPALKFALGSMFGFMMGGVAGLIQANLGLNVVFHNTQWVVALHAHTFLLTGVGMMLFSVLYALVPMLTKLEYRSKSLIHAHFWLWIIGSVTMAYAMGMAGARGMLRRTFYEGTTFQPYTLAAIIGGILVAMGFVAFLVNLVGTLGLTNVVALFVPERWLEKRQPAAAQA
jgi:cytochrome c oxidase subunit 1